MPPRWLRAVILCFWLATTGWLIWSRVRPLLDTGQPPPFDIDYMTDVSPERAVIRWRVWVGAEPPGTINYFTLYADLAARFADPAAQVPLGAVASHVAQRLGPEYYGFTAYSSISYREQDDSFTFHTRFAPPLSRSHMTLDLGKLAIREMTSEYRVGRAGNMLGVEGHFLFDLRAPSLQLRDIQVNLKGDVRGEQFFGRYEIEALGSPFKQRQELPPVPVSRQGSVLLPLNPVARVRGLALGQTWTVPGVDPFGAALSGVGSKADLKRMMVRVLPRTVPLHLATTSVECLVIEYQTEGEEPGPNGWPRTWVRAADGLVIRLEADVAESRLVLQREYIPEP